ncbi:AAA family ATPase [Lacticaseibacillus porcinae]|uniref:AAA family ATPase n=1 Tax=Lacticaseibacillus porcinae TaxID=1123687 RepID=UPI000F798B1B|nr:AAA family ATPase [Lacticaseibacillus porcinae]
MPTLVIIRGNSGSGKTSMADTLQVHFGADACLVIHQDQVRRELLHANDHVGTPTVALIKDLIRFGHDHYPLVIVEGILRRDVYGEMLEQVVDEWQGPTLIYYLDVPFATCVAHNAQRFDEAIQKRWWRVDDVLSAADRRLPQRDVALVLSDLNRI